MIIWGICENQADEFMAYYYKSIDQTLNPFRPINYQQSKNNRFNEKTEIKTFLNLYK